MSIATVSTQFTDQGSPLFVPGDDGDEIGWTAEDLAERFGSMPLHRICFDPPPGTATEADALAWEARTNRLFELIDGVLVEKTMSSYESYLAVQIAVILSVYVQPRKLGVVLGADGMLKIMPDMIRIPDACFIAKEKLPGKFSPHIPISSLAPDLAVEVLSEGNTREEMERKLKEYFLAGVDLVWFVDLDTRSVRVFTSPDDSVLLAATDTLTGGAVLPGFALPVADLFASLPPEQTP